MDYFNNEFWGSTDLKGYLTSPKYAKWKKENPEQKESAALDFGTKWHKFIECLIKGESFPYTIIEPLINPKTGEAYGSDTIAQKAHMASVQNPILKSDYERIISMYNSINHLSEFKYWMRKGDPEPEFYDKIDLTKWKPDILLNHQIIDWKTTAELSFDNIIRSIRYNYNYDFSAAHYQFKEYERTGTIKKFFWCFIQSVAPFDYLIVDASNYIIDVYDDVIIYNESHYKYSKILEVHKNCVQTGIWDGLSSYVKPNLLNHRHFDPINNNKIFNF